MYRVYDLEFDLEPTRQMTPKLVERIGQCHCTTCQASLDADWRDYQIMLKLAKAALGSGGEDA